MNMHGICYNLTSKVFLGTASYCYPTRKLYCNECFLITYFREICEKLGIASYTIDDIDKDGIGVIIEKALEKINPK